jgi:hypothetical protein
VKGGQSFIDDDRRSCLPSAAPICQARFLPVGYRKEVDAEFTVPPPPISKMDVYEIKIKDRGQDIHKVKGRRQFAD